MKLIDNKGNAISIHDSLVIYENITEDKHTVSINLSESIYLYKEIIVCSDHKQKGLTIVIPIITNQKVISVGSVLVQNGAYKQTTASLVIDDDKKITVSCYCTPDGGVYFRKIIAIRK